MKYTFFWDETLTAEQVAAVAAVAAEEGATLVGDVATDGTATYAVGKPGSDGFDSALRIGRSIGVGGEMAYRYGGGWRMFYPF